MYIKKSVLIIGSVLLVLASAFLAIGAVNPFGFAAFGELVQFTYVSRMIQENYYEEVDEDIYRNVALQGMAMATGDPYTQYIWGEEAEEYLEDVLGNYQGVGLYIENQTLDDTIQVVSAIAGSPAEAAGITTGDKILKINGESFSGQQMQEAAAAMRGAEGTEVVVTVLKSSTGVTEDITLIRKEIEVQSVSGNMITQDIGRINITQFLPGTAEKFAEVYRDLSEQGMRSLVLDLRNNPGGLSDEAVEIANMFLPDGRVIVYTLDRYERREEYRSTGEAGNIPIVILTNQGTASASEILTGALKDHNIGVQIGEKTYGKGVVQGVYQVGEDGVLSVTIARFYTPKGICIHGEGIAPDEEVVMEPEKYIRLSALLPEEDVQLQAALAYLKR